MTYFQFIAHCLRARTGEFGDFLGVHGETPFHERAEADWWREFLAFVAMRQNFPTVNLEELSK